MATYPPVLLASVSAIPDDSAVAAPPRHQVDYLSHQWREEDVWRSWRNMTRLKHEIANGVRLENASWRTWWKQRNGLKTISPETLNWLKDSDVTWLYGPLHTADPVPRPAPGLAATLGLDAPPPFSAPALVRKPILKHRSIGELLASDFPLSPVFSPPDSDDDAPAHITSDTEPKATRPPLVHTKSDTHIARCGPARLFRHDSPPRVGPLSSGLPLRDSPPASVPSGQKRKHISFNTFVEQRIAIDKPKRKRPHPNPRFGNACPLDDDGYDEDSEDGIIDEADEILFDDEADHPSYPPIHHSLPAHDVSPPSSSTSEEDEDEEVLHMRVRHSPPTHAPPIPHSPTHSSSSASSSSSRSRPKTHSAASGQRLRGKHGFVTRSPSVDKELVTIALIAPTVLKTRLDEEDEDDDQQQPLPPYPLAADDARDSAVELVYVPPSYIYSTHEEDMGKGDNQTATDDSQASPLTNSLQLVGTGIDLAGTSSNALGALEGKPEVIVSSADTPRSRSRSASRSRSRSRTPSPNTTITTESTTQAIPCSNWAVHANGGAQGMGNSLLAPSVTGRSASSPSLSCQAQVEQPRGRSIARTSSFSDRESLHTGSPLGSLSPDGSVGLGIGSVGVRDRERDSRPAEGKRPAERGRDRLARRSGSHSGSGSNSSLSPEDPRAVAATVAHVVVPSPVPEPRRKSTSGSSSSGSSTPTVVPASHTHTRLPPRLVLDAKPITQTSYTEAPASIPISPGCVHEEQESISRQPTPANSPVSPVRPSTLISKPPRHERRSSSGSSRSPTRDGDDAQQGTLVGRAVEIMSNAGAFLGSFWHTGTPTSIPSHV